MEKAANTVCPTCGSEFYRCPSFIAKRAYIYCSPECRKSGKQRGKIIPCKLCGTMFYQRAAQASQGYGNYCSRACFAETTKKRQTFTCIVCGASFERRPWQVAKGYTKVCSRDCRIIYMRGENPMLRVNLFTETQKQKWRDDHCARCDATEDLQLDHIIPRCAGGKPTRDNAQTLCRKCNRDKYWLEDKPKYLS